MKNYDGVDNRLSRRWSLGSLGAQSFSYSANDWIDNDANPNNGSTYFDANGNTVSLDGTWQYDWANRLTNYNNGAATYVHDANGNRIKKTAGGVTTWYLVATVNPSGYAQFVEEHTGASPGNLSRRYTYGLDLVSQSRWTGSAWETHFYLTDGLGSTRALLNVDGSITDTYTYDAYGTLIASTGTTPNNYLFCGEQWDPSIGQYYLRDRTMHPGYGRFWTRDRWQGNQQDPLSLHKYLYAANDPVDRIDPSGNESFVSINMSSLIMGQMLGYEFKGSEATLTKARMMFGGNDAGLDQIIMGLAMINVTTDTVGDFQMAGMGVFGAIKGYQMVKKLCTNPAVQKSALNILSRIAAVAARKSSGAVRVDLEDVAKVLSYRQETDAFVGIVQKDGAVKIFKAMENGIDGHPDLVRNGIVKVGEAYGFTVFFDNRTGRPQIVNMSELNVHMGGAKDGTLPPEILQQLELIFGQHE